MAPTATKDDAKDDDMKVKSEKRKKTDSAKKEDKEPSAKAAKQETPSIYQTVLAMERRESEERSGEADHARWREACGDLRGLMKDIFEMKTKKAGAGAGGDVTEKRIQASLLFVTLKKLNRLEKLRVKACREATAASKQGVDSFNLQLQNLLYEVLHLKKEITKCVQFKSADEALELVPEHQFFAEAPEEIANPEVTRADPHALQLARLQWELERRKALSGEAEAREGERDGLELGIRQREERLRELQPQLRAVLASTQPVQEYLALPLDTRREQASLAKLLPAPLYIAYTQVAAFAEACDPRVEVSVKGEEEEARKWREDKQEEEEEAEDEVVEQESQDDEGEKSRSKSKSVAKAGARRAALMTTHPLTVEMVVRGEGEVRLVVTLHHLPTLGLVTVRSAVVGEVRGAGEVLDPSTMLAHLFPGDCGLVLPPTHSLRLREAGMTDMIDTLLPGHRAFTWAQKLCGLEFLAEEPQETPDPAPAAARAAVRGTVEALRERLGARLDLARQLATLATAKPSDHLLPFALAGTYPARVVAKLKSWAPTDWETYSLAAATKHLTTHKVVDENDFLYKATCARDKATVVAWVAVKPNYPASPPVFCLAVAGLAPRPADAAPRAPGSPRVQGESQDTSEWVRDWEMELNLNWSDQLAVGRARKGLVAAQLHRLLVTMDVVLEAASEAGATDQTFAKAQVFFSPIRGRMRRLPLQFCPKTQVFQQR